MSRRQDPTGEVEGDRSVGVGSGKSLHGASDVDVYGGSSQGTKVRPP